jgi:hypothetical protein
MRQADCLFGIMLNSIHKPPASFRFKPMIRDLPVSAEHFQFSSRQVGVAYEWSYRMLSSIAEIGGYQAKNSNYLRKSGLFKDNMQ